jgi:hypothetical protein
MNKMKPISSTKIQPVTQDTINKMIQVFDSLNKHVIESDRLIREMIHKKWRLELIRLNQKKILSDALIIVYKHKVETSKCIFSKMIYRKRLFHEIKNWRSLNAAILYINAIINE